MFFAYVLGFLKRENGFLMWVLLSAKEARLKCWASLRFGVILFYTGVLNLEQSPSHKQFSFGFSAAVEYHICKLGESIGRVVVLVFARHRV